MITVPRLAVRQFRTLLRHSVPTRYRMTLPWVVFQADRNGLTVAAQHADAALAYHVAGNYSTDLVAVPAKALEAFEGRTSEVTLEPKADGKVEARWSEKGLPRVVEYETTDPATFLKFPELPAKLTAMPAQFWGALADAMQTAAREDVRFTVSKVQLRGTGQIAATDGRQMLLQSGFSFPWKDDVLIPRLPLFGDRELAKDTPIQIGRTKTHLTLQFGAWTIHVPADTESRFPKVEAAVPLGAHTLWRVQEADAAFLLKAVGELPGDKDDHAPITVDLSAEQAVVRARASDQSRPTELVLQKADYNGAPLRFSSNRQYLLRALQLGFREFRIVNAETPVVAQDAQRKYVWMTLGKDAVVPPSADALRIRSPVEEQPSIPASRKAAPAPQSRPGRPPRPASQPRPTMANGKALSSQPVNDLNELIAEATALKGVGRDLSARGDRLLVALRRQKEQSRCVTTALSTLQRLQKWMNWSK